MSKCIDEVRVSGYSIPSISCKIMLYGVVYEQIGEYLTVSRG